MNAATLDPALPYWFAAKPRRLARVVVIVRIAGDDATAGKMLAEALGPTLDAEGLDHSPVDWVGPARLIRAALPDNPGQGRPLIDRRQRTTAGEGRVRIDPSPAARMPPPSQEEAC